MKKKVIALLMCISLAAGSLMGCSSGGTKDTQPGTEAKTQQTEPVTAATEAQEETPEPIGETSVSTKQPPVSKIVNGEDTRQRAIITTDLECDDMNSMIHLSLFFNDVDVDGIIYSASQFHFVGDGESTLGEVNPNFLCEGDAAGAVDADAAKLTEYRPMELGWIESLWENEYAQCYPYLSQNDPDYPTPEYLKSITKVGNVAFEGDVRADTEGSDLIKEAILDDDPRTLYLFSWGGFNTIARALLSIADDYKDTDQWESILDKVYNKVVISGYGQDNSYKDHIQELYPNLKLMNASDGYAGYFTAITGQADSRYTFNSEWLTENIKFDHGALLEKYGLMGDGTYYKGEPDKFQYGQTLTIDWGLSFIPAMTFDQYDFLAEGDSGGFMALIPVGLRGLEHGVYGTWAGKLTYDIGTADTRDMATAIQEGDQNKTYSDYNFVTGADANGTKRYLLAYQLEWAARADWCVNDYDSCNHAPMVQVENADLGAAPGMAVELNGIISDPDNDDYTAYWWVDEYTGTYCGNSKNLQVWNPVSEKTSFTVPADAAPGDSFCITLQVTDKADAPMTRYAQVIVTVTEPEAPVGESK